MNFSDQGLDGAAFRRCAMANAVFDYVNPSGARLANGNLFGRRSENANFRGLQVFGHDVAAWIKSRSRKGWMPPGLT